MVKLKQKAAKPSPVAAPEGPRSNQKVRDAVLWNGTRHMQMFRRFEACFGHSLDEFWINNARGLDLIKFDKKVVRSGGKSLLIAVRSKWGKEGVAILKRLTPKPVKK